MTTAELRGANLAIHEHQNDAFDVTFNFVNADGTPFTSLSAYTLTANVWSRSAAIQPITITVLDTHIRQLSLTADQMTALATVPNLTWSLQATMGGRPQTWVAGSFNLYRQGQGVNTTTGNQIDVYIGSTTITIEMKTNTVIAGGNTNDLLVKQSSTDFDVAWQDEISIDQINFDTTAAEELTAAGQMAWDPDVDTIDVLLRNGTATPTLMHIGQDEYFYAKASAAITRGQVVYYTGTDGASGHILAAPFLADGTHPSKTVIGVASQDADIGEFVHVLWRGKLRKINTSLLTPGILYASTTVAGGFQSTAPVAPNNIVTVAVAIDQKNNGTILVRPTFAGSLAETENVLISNPQDGDVLTYNSATGLWINQQPAGSFSPLDLSPVLWLDAADTSTITEVGGAVSQWDDKSGNGNDVTQGVAANQPTSGTRTINGLNVLDFDGSNDRMSGGDVLDLGTEGKVVFVVAEMDTISGGDALIGKGPAGPSAGRWFITRSGADDKMVALVEEAANRDARAPSAFTSTDPTIHVMRYERDTVNGLQLRTNGVVEASVTTVGTTNYNIANSLTVGSIDSTVNFLEGTIGEIIVVDGTLTAGEISLTESYLANKWGITL